MIKDISKLTKGQSLRVDLKSIRDRLPQKVLDSLKQDPKGKLVGYKMVDGNQFALVLDLNIGSTQWFFKEELSEIESI